MTQDGKRNIKPLLMLALIGASLGTFAWFNGMPRSSRASSGGPLDDYLLYGVVQSTGQLVRHEFATDTTTAIGTVAQTGGSAMTGIKATAYVPRNSNLFGFWQDPADRNTKLVYINTDTAKATIIGSSVGRAKITGATAVLPTGGGTVLGPDEATPLSQIMQYKLYAVEQEEPVGFNITSDQVVPTETYAAKITVLGAAISYGGTYDMAVTTKVRVGATTYEPFGGYATPVSGNVNDSADDEVHNDPADCPRSYVVPTTFPSGTAVTVVGKSWTRNLGASGAANSDWTTAYTADSSVDVSRVTTLRDGDPAPALAGFLDQLSARDYVEDYIDFTTNKMTLGPNQAIYLMELGSSITGAAADFQDLVVLVTLGRTVEELGGLSTTVSGAVTGSISINPNNSPDYEFTIVKPDGSVITRENLNQDAAVDGSGVYYSGSATSVYVRPKGGGTQNGLIVNGTAVTLNNNTAYTISGSGMTVTVRNDMVNGSGKAMGHWWVDFAGDAGDLEDDMRGVKLILVNPKTGLTAFLMKLSQEYESLASTDGKVFYAGIGSDLYKIDLGSQTETLVGSVAGTLKTLEFAGSTLYRFNAANNCIRAVDPSSAAATGTDINPSASGLEAMIFMRVADAPATDTVRYD